VISALLDCVIEIRGGFGVFLHQCVVERRDFVDQSFRLKIDLC